MGLVCSAGNLPLAEQIEGTHATVRRSQFAGVTGSAIGGAWAVDQRRFATTGAPFTLNANWSWAASGRAQFRSIIWVNGGNAQMGIVQTSLLATHDAATVVTRAIFRAPPAPPDKPARRGYRMFCVGLAVPEC